MKWGAILLRKYSFVDLVMSVNDLLEKKKSYLAVESYDVEAPNS